MNLISVTILISRNENKVVEIDTDLIDYIKPAIASTDIHFTDGTSITVKEKYEEIKRAISRKK